jgi:hypothetical protein
VIHLLRAQPHEPSPESEPVGDGAERVRERLPAVRREHARRAAFGQRPAAKPVAGVVLSLSGGVGRWALAPGSLTVSTDPGASPRAS